MNERTQKMLTLRTKAERTAKAIADAGNEHIMKDYQEHQKGENPMQEQEK